jgi:hypothetical protein
MFKTPNEKTENAATNVTPLGKATYKEKTMLYSMKIRI